MLHVLFDYGLNVKLCVAAGAVQTVTWAAWVVRRLHPGRGRMLLFLVRMRLSISRPCHVAQHGTSQPVGCIEHGVSATKRCCTSKMCGPEVMRCWAYWQFIVTRVSVLARVTASNRVMQGKPSTTLRPGVSHVQVLRLPTGAHSMITSNVPDCRCRRS